MATGRDRRIWWVPALVLLCVITVLVGLRISQYSIGMYGTPRTESSLGGVDRPIRSDEWMVRLPWLLSQSSRGFERALVTAGSHDSSITYDLPVRSPAIILKPHLLPYLILDIERAVSAEWWIIMFGSGLGVYFLLLSLRVRPSLAGPLGFLVASNPGMHWWTVNSSFVVTFYGCMGASALLAAWRQTAQSRVLLRGSCGGWLLACAVVGLYPPFQIPVLGAIGLLLIVMLMDNAGRTGWQNALRPVVAAGVVFISALGWFVFTHRAGLSAMSETVYPGTRRTSAGGQDAVSILGAPIDLAASRITACSVNRTNQSENATSLLIATPIIVLMCGGLLGSLRTLAARLQRVLSAWFAALLAWMLIPLPDIIGRLTLLDRVPTERIKPVIIITGVLIVGVHLHFHAEMAERKSRLLAVALFAFATVWAGSHYVVNDVTIDRPAIWWYTLLWMAPLAIALVRFPRAGLWCLAAVSIFTASRINPFYTSLAPITNNAIVQVISKHDPDRSSPWATFSATAQVRGIMVSTGARVESAASPYPDREFWRRFDPSGKYEEQWNRYGHVHFVAGQGEPVLSNPQADVIEVAFDPCVATSPLSAGTYFVESDPGLVPCARVIEEIEYQSANWYVLVKD